MLKPNADLEIPKLQLSYKPQKISPKSKLTVKDLLQNKIRSSYTHQQFVTEVMKPLQIEDLLDQKVQKLSGGELQRVALCLCLGQVTGFNLCYRNNQVYDVSSTLNYGVI